MREVNMRGANLLVNLTIAEKDSIYAELIRRFIELHGPTNDLAGRSEWAIGGDYTLNDIQDVLSEFFSL